MEEPIKHRKAPVYAIRALAAALAAVSSFALASAGAADFALPDEFLAVRGQTFSLAENGKTRFTVRAADGFISAADTTDGTGRYEICVFGAVPVKTVRVKYESRKNVALSGESFGIRLYSDGVMIVGLSEITDENGGKSSPAYDAGLRSGDIVKEIGGVKVTLNSQVTKIINESSGRTLSVKFTRSGKDYSSSVKPVKTQNGYKAGMWVRDSVAGIGTLTYTDPEKMTFAGLGHGITDSDSGEIYPVAGGSAVKARITSAVKGEQGSPGELVGYFTDEYIGELYANTETGVYGRLDRPPESGYALTPVAYKQEIKEGEAVILTSVGGGVREYSAVIERISFTDSKTRNMIIRVTDRELLSQTGGIVQGMSGSPIIQDGKLVGAVTHVFVNDPSRGYAIFAENMTESEENLLQSAA